VQGKSKLIEDLCHFPKKKKHILSYFFCEN